MPERLATDLLLRLFILGAKSVRNILLLPDRIMPIPRGVRQVAANNKGDVIYEPEFRTQGASRSLPEHVSGAVASTHPHPSRPPQLGCRFGALAECQGILSPLYELT
jgi:hypothetical protein